MSSLYRSVAADESNQLGTSASSNASTSAVTSKFIEQSDANLPPFTSPSIVPIRDYHVGASCINPIVQLELNVDNNNPLV